MTVNYTTLQVERLERLIAEAVAAERERCRSIVENMADRLASSHICDEFLDETVLNCAKAISDGMTPIPFPKAD